MPLEKISIHNRFLETRLKSIQSWPISQEEKDALLEFVKLASMGKINKGKRLTVSRLIRYTDLIKIPAEYLKKPFTQVTIKDFEKFDEYLEKSDYAQSTKITIRIALKIYIKWRLGEEKALPLVGWFDTRLEKKTPDFLSENDISLLFKACKSSRERYLIALLFDTGARAEEFHNIRMSDIIMPEGSFAFPRIVLRVEFSKTNGRTIGLYWKESLEALRDYYRERKAEGIKPDEQIFSWPYGNSRQFINKIGKLVLKRRVHYHLFRHSSATYYANKLNRQELCIRYGWAFSSRMPDVYISRVGMDTKKLDEQFKQTQIEDLQKQIDKLTFQINQVLDVGTKTILELRVNKKK